MCTECITLGQAQAHRDERVGRCCWWVGGTYRTGVVLCAHELMPRVRLPPSLRCCPYPAPPPVSKCQMCSNPVPGTASSRRWTSCLTRRRWSSWRSCTCATCTAPTSETSGSDWLFLAVPACCPPLPARLLGAAPCGLACGSACCAPPLPAHLHHHRHTHMRPEGTLRHQLPTTRHAALGDIRYGVSLTKTSSNRLSQTTIPA